MFKEGSRDSPKKGGVGGGPHQSSSKVFAELQSVPWTSLSIPPLSTPIFVKSKFTDSCYYLIFSDLLRVWYRFSDKNSIKEEKLEFNPQFAATTAKILDILRILFLSQQTDAQYLCHFLPSKKMVLSLSTKIDFYMFQWTFECEPMQDGEDIRDHIIIPFIYANKLLGKQANKTPSESRSILKRSKSSFLKNEEPSNINNTTQCMLCNQSPLPPPLPPSQISSLASPTLTATSNGANTGRCCCATDDDIAPLECMTHPWFDPFTSKAYQRKYMAYVSKVQTAKTPTGTLKDKEKELNEGERTADFQGTLTYDTEPIVQPMLSRYSSVEEDDEILSRNTRSNSGYFSSQGSEAATSDSDTGQDENPDEIRRRNEIAERLERERKKKETVQNKRKRFV